MRARALLRESPFPTSPPGVPVESVSKKNQHHVRYRIRHAIGHQRYQAEGIRVVRVGLAEDVQPHEQVLRERTRVIQYNICSSLRFFHIGHFPKDNFPLSKDGEFAFANNQVRRRGESCVVVTSIYMSCRGTNTGSTELR